MDFEDVYDVDGFGEEQRLDLNDLFNFENPSEAN